MLQLGSGPLQLATLLRVLQPEHPAGSSLRAGAGVPSCGSCRVLPGPDVPATDGCRPGRSGLGEGPASVLLPGPAWT